MIRVALVEDDAQYRDQFLSFLRRYAEESGQRMRVSVFADGDEILETYQADYDLILMDIVMPFVDGMTAAERIRTMDTEVVIIFITGTPQFVMRGYSVDALDYVLKPINYFAFSQRIERAVARMAKRRRRYISVPIKGGIQKLDISQIRYVEVLDHDLLYHTERDSIMTRGTLSEAEEQLGSDRFFRCNKCYLVNLDYVDGIQNYDILLGDERIQVSRSKKKALMDALNDYMNEVSK